MKWLLATLNNLNRAADFDFKHVHPNHEKIEEAVDIMVHDILEMTSSNTNNNTNSQQQPATSSTNELALTSQGQKNGKNTLTATSATSSSSPYVQLLREKQNKQKPSLAKILSKTVCEITSTQLEEEERRREDGPVTLSKKIDEFEKEVDLSHLPSDRSWEYSLPTVLRDRARALRLEFFNNRKQQDQVVVQQEQQQQQNNNRQPREKTQYEQSVVQTAYEAQSVKSDRDILNFLGAVLAVDFRHWISGTHGDEIAKLEGCWCRSRKSAVLPCPCQLEARENEDRATHKDKKVFFETDVRQMWNRDMKQDGKLVRGSMAMVTKMRDAVDVAGEGDANKYWFRPAIMIRRLLEEEDGRYEIIDDLFTGCDESGKNPLQFPAANARVSILTQLAEFYRDSGKDFYDLVVESQRCLIGDPIQNSRRDSTTKATAAPGEQNNTNNDDDSDENSLINRLQREDFLSLPGLLPSLCRNFPRFYDIALFTRPQEEEDKEEQNQNLSATKSYRRPKFTVAQRPQLYSGDGNVSTSKFSAPLSTLAASSPHRRRVASGRPFTSVEEEKEITPQGKTQVPVLFMKLAQLFAVSVRSCRRLFCSNSLKWLRDDEPFMDEEQNLTIASDYQIPNALRFGDLITYSEEMQLDIDARRILPATSLKEVEVRLVSVIAATALRLRFRERVDEMLMMMTKQQQQNNAEEGNTISAEQKNALAVAKEVFTTSVLDYVIWLFGRSLTSSGLGCHHLTPGIMY